MKFLFRIYNRFFAKDKDLADRLRHLLGFTPANLAIFKLAFSHKSSNTEKSYSNNNERLEYLGDAVLGWVVADFTYRDPERFPEGRLTDIRKTVVNTNALAAVARRIGLGAHLTLGEAEAANGGRDKTSILSDALEAVFGAVYLDGGTECAKQVVLHLLTDEIADAIAGRAQFDYKTLLQEWLAQNDQGRPRYEHREFGPAHEPTFVVTLAIDGLVVSEASGGSKKAAEQNAAEMAFKKLNA